VSPLNLAEFLLVAENVDEFSLGYQRFFHAAAWSWLTAVQCINLCPNSMLVVKKLHPNPCRRWRYRNVTIKYVYS